MKDTFFELPEEFRNFEWLLTVFDFMNAGLVIVDMKDKNQPVIYANPKFYDMTGYEKEDVIEKNCRFLQGEATDKNTANNIKIAIKNKKREKFIIKNFKKDGKAFWNELYLSPVFSDNGGLTHYIGIQHDVTDEMPYEI